MNRSETDAAVRLAAEALGPRARCDVALAPLTTYRVGGDAALFFVAESPHDLATVRDVIRATGVDVVVIGRGSNLLVADAGFAGIAVTLGEAFARIAVEATTITAGAAAALPVVARRSAAAGLTGFEWAVGVPGSIGGGVRMNAGGHGSDMAASLRRVRVIDLRGDEDGDVAAGALDLGYRHSNISASRVVVEAELALASGDREKAEAEIADIVRWRRANQPGGQNAGSVFVNPEGDSAGRLVDVAGCRGLRLGTAVVSDRHANFIIADPGGRADDVVALMAEVRRRVAAATGVVLEPETRLVGYDPLPEDDR